MSENLYIFIDESGNFDFSPSGTKYFVLTAVTTRHPLKNRKRFHALRYKILSNGRDQEAFHATEDQQFIRDGFFKLLDEVNDIEIDSVVAQKNKTNPSLYQEVKTFKDTGKSQIKNTDNEFYRVLCQVLLQYIFQRHCKERYNKTIVILSSIFTNRKRNLILKALKPYLKNRTDKPYYIYFHRSEADINCQIADYCSWAIYVKNERNESRPFREIKEKIRSEFDIFKRGKTRYYEYEE